MATGNATLGLLASIPITVALVATAHADPANVEKTAQGPILATPAGKTLYTYNRDEPDSGKSHCNKQCAGAWPPFIAAKGLPSAGKWKVISRDDGLPQWSYKGKPLYTFFRDDKPGEMKGESFEGRAWLVARP